MSRKMVAILLSVVFTTSVLGGCGSKGSDSTSTAPAEEEVTT